MSSKHQIPLIFFLLITATGVSLAEEVIQAVSADKINEYRKGFEKALSQSLVAGQAWPEYGKVTPKPVVANSAKETPEEDSTKYQSLPLPSLEAITRSRLKQLMKKRLGNWESSSPLDPTAPEVLAHPKQEHPKPADGHYVKHGDEIG